jgi:DNA segregation ATPase FtsK/SpoIIIE-like protein
MRPVILLSSLDCDETLDRANEYIRRIQMSSLVENPLSLDELRDSLVIFDDCEALPDDEAKAAESALNLIATQGRHSNT